MSAIGATLGLLLAIFLITRRVNTVYSLMTGALVGGLAMGEGVSGTVSLMISGVGDVVPAVVRVLAAGVLSGVLITTGAAATIANTIVERLGEKRVYAALAIATMGLTAIGVFVDVAVITVAPIALHIGRRVGAPVPVLLLMMIGGGKCGNIISPNPNTIIAAETFGADLYAVMMANAGAALVGLAFTVGLAWRLLPSGLRKASAPTADADAAAERQLRREKDDSLPGFRSSIVAPAVSIVLLALRPVCGVNIDPMVALPAGGLCGLLAMRRTRLTLPSLSCGLEKMAPVAVLLIGTGTIAGVIKASAIKDVILSALSSTGIGEVLLAPVSGILMSAATASTTAGVTVAAQSFSDVILASGVAAVWGAAMINSGATVLDHLPHGSFFHATGGVTDTPFAQRLRLIPCESAIGLVLAAGTVATYFIFR